MASVYQQKFVDLATTGKVFFNENKNKHRMSIGKS